MVLEKQVIIKLLQFSIQVGVDCANLSPNFPKIPFLLIEDLLEGQTLKHAASIWEIIESMVDTLTLPELFSRGKFVILRTCNSLLRRLSKSCHTEVMFVDPPSLLPVIHTADPTLPPLVRSQFCGRVLMFLAAIYPLSERSAVNLMGKVCSSLTLPRLTLARSTPTTPRATRTKLSSSRAKALTPLSRLWQQSGTMTMRSPPSSPLDL
jgi:hypothetical protein